MRLQTFLNARSLHLSMHKPGGGNFVVW